MKRRPLLYRVLVNGRPLRGQAMRDLDEDTAITVAAAWRCSSGGPTVRIEQTRLNDDGSRPDPLKWWPYSGA